MCAEGVAAAVPVVIQELLPARDVPAGQQHQPRTLARKSNHFGQAVALAGVVEQPPIPAGLPCSVHTVNRKELI